MSWHRVDTPASWARVALQQEPGGRVAAQASTPRYGTLFWGFPPFGFPDRGLKAPTRVPSNAASSRGSAHMVPPTLARLGVGPGFGAFAFQGAKRQMTGRRSSPRAIRAPAPPGDLERRASAAVAVRIAQPGRLSTRVHRREVVERGVLEQPPERDALTGRLRSELSPHRRGERQLNSTERQLDPRAPALRLACRRRDPQRPAASPQLGAEIRGRGGDELLERPALSPRLRGEAPPAEVAEGQRQRPLYLNLETPPGHGMPADLATPAVACTYRGRGRAIRISSLRRP
jgi:hypothetical protein